MDVEGVHAFKCPSRFLIYMTNNDLWSLMIIAQNKNKHEYFDKSCLTCYNP